MEVRMLTTTHFNGKKIKDEVYTVDAATGERWVDAGIAEGVAPPEPPVPPPAPPEPGKATSRTK